MAHQHTPTAGSGNQALRHRARTGLLIAAQLNDPTRFAFWRGYHKGLSDIADGAGSKAATKDQAAPSGHEPPSKFKGAWAALSDSAEQLTMPEVQQLLAANIEQVSADAVPSPDVDAVEQLKHNALAIVHPDDEHSPTVVDGDDSSPHGCAPCVAGACTIDGQSAATQSNTLVPDGGVVVVDQWTAVRYKNGTVMLQRANSAGRVVEAYRPTSAEFAALDFLAIMQGCEPLRVRPRALEPIGPNHPPRAVSEGQTAQKQGNNHGFNSEPIGARPQIPCQINIAARGKSWANGKLIDGASGYPTREAYEKAAATSADTADTAATLRRCIGALMACEEMLREDAANMLKLQGFRSLSTPAPWLEAERQEFNLRTALAELAALTIAEARATSERLQAQAQATAAKGGAA